jgi:hypothetical protein
MDLIWQIVICVVGIFSGCGIIVGNYHLYKYYKSRDTNITTVEPVDNFLSFDNTISDYSLI